MEGNWRWVVLVLVLQGTSCETLSVVWLKASGLNVVHSNHSDILLHASVALVNFLQVCTYKTSDFCTNFECVSDHFYGRHGEI